MTIPEPGDPHYSGPMLPPSLSVAPPRRSAGLAPIRILSVSDSESYLKWATQMLSSLPDVEGRVFLVDNPILPTDEQIASAVAGTDWEHREIPVIARSDLAQVIADHSPDIVLGAATGPIVAQVFLTAHTRTNRPALVSGLPGMGLPASGKGMNYRRLMDAFIAHSAAEVAAYTEASTKSQVPCEVMLARLPMLRSEGIPQLKSTTPEAAPHTLVFAPQAKVPAERVDREAIIAALAKFADRNPDSTAVVKMRSRPGEFETHHEQHSYFEILEDFRTRRIPSSSRIELGYGPLSDFLTEGSALVTVSSTAALESIDRGIPTLLISDFGFDDELLNEVFEDSGATGTLADVAAGAIGFPDPEWLTENYFHPVDGQLRRDLGLVATRARAGQLPNRRAALLKQKRMLLRAELRTVTPAPVVSAYRRLRGTR
ncbi:hypothetical protein SAMN04489752_1332 [Brevibacterium siliguriense]|uniref:Uncharacterized protein n=1 Tax=Brevibacterium siliguriense TaxID=1136497 RepID=A0A1H1QSM2_9MICO|nr:DUF6716 putative glycosyltransferase [Brevibacterium siliguriense]SDS26471.1 hypothetical protein SAMN04489752_1332 [Brevibacterium siliguriense]